MVTDFGRSKPFSLWFLTVYVFLFPALEALSNAVLPIGTVVLGAALIGIWLLESSYRNVRIPRVTAILLALLLFWNATSIYWSVDIASSIDRLTSLSLVIALYIVTFDVARSYKALFQLIVAYIAGVGVLALSSVQNVLLGETYNELSNRYSALGTDPNNFGVMIASAIPLALACIPPNKHLIRMSVFVYVAALAIVGIATASRGAVLALLLVYVGYVLLHVQLKSLLRLVMFLSIAGTFIYFGIQNFVPDEALERLTNPLSQYDLEDGRFLVWQQALELGMEHPLRGIGTGAFLTASGTEQAHNTFLSAFAETGLLGLILWALLWVTHFRYSFSHRAASALDDRLSTGLLLALVAVLIGALTLNWEVRKPIFLLWALTAARLYISPQIELRPSVSNHRTLAQENYRTQIQTKYQRD